MISTILMISTFILFSSFRITSYNVCYTKLLRRIQTIARDCDPQVEISLETYQNILIIHVPEGTVKPYRCNKGFFIRSGANSRITSYNVCYTKLLRFWQERRNNPNIKAAQNK